MHPCLHLSTMHVFTEEDLVWRLACMNFRDEASGTDSRRNRKWIHVEMLWWIADDVQPVSMHQCFRLKPGSCFLTDSNPCLPVCSCNVLKCCPFVITFPLTLMSTAAWKWKEAKNIIMKRFAVKGSFLGSKALCFFILRLVPSRLPFWGGSYVIYVICCILSHYSKMLPWQSWMHLFFLVTPPSPLVNYFDGVSRNRLCVTLR